MMGLSDGEKISMIRLAVLIQYTRVTDRRTDIQTDGIGVAYTRYSMHAVARKKSCCSHFIYVYLDYYNSFQFMSLPVYLCRPIVSKRLNVSSKFFYYPIGPSF